MSGITVVLPYPQAGLTQAAQDAASQAKAKRNLELTRQQEEALVRRIQAGEEPAFQELVDRYQSKIFSIIYGILRNHNDAEDIAQQVFTKVYFSLRNFDFRSSLLTWIYKITVNECYDYLRKKRVRKLVYESDFTEDDTLRMENSGVATDPTQPIDEQLTRQDLLVKIMNKVSEEDRSLLMLKEVEGHSVEELAQMTGMNENTVKVKLFRARQKLVKAAERLLRLPSGKTANEAF